MNDQGTDFPNSGGAHRTGAGVGYQGENLDSTTAASTAAFSSESATGTGVGPSGGAGGHYTTGNTGYTGTSSNTASTGHSGNQQPGITGGADAGATQRVTDNLGAGVGAGAVGGSGSDYTSGNNNSTTNTTSDGKTTGHYGTVDDHPRGEPISDPKEIDTGGPHSLVFHNGKYVHRRDIEGEGSTGV